MRIHTMPYSSTQTISATPLTDEVEAMRVGGVNPLPLLSPVARYCATLRLAAAAPRSTPQHPAAVPGRPCPPLAACRAAVTPLCPGPAASSAVAAPRKGQA
jgi:hypothetical protein